MVEKITLDNGIRIVHEKLEYLRSCSLGLWVESGSRHEPDDLCGISHFIEHMLFKGTENRSAAQLAADFDAVGGQVNAFTTKEHTCFYCRTLGEYLPKAAELLCDMYFNSAFEESAVNLERSVIVEEIGMYEDTPDDLVNEELFSAVYNGYKLGRPILGTKKSLDDIDGKMLKEYRRLNYTPRNTVIALCGSYSDEDVQKLVEVFSKMEDLTPPSIEESHYQKAFTLKKKDIEQNHLMIAFNGLPVGDDRRYSAQVLNAILGSGMSSWLFQRVRERNGLCYTIYSFNTSYINTGVFGIYVALSKETELRAIALIIDVIKEMMEKGIGQEELERTKTQLKSNVLMGLENTSSRMSTIARNEFVYGRAIDEDEISKGFDSVTRESVLEVARELFDFKNISFSAVGKVREEEEYKTALGM
ncbi:MAG: pitrilysin family protein [Clostridiaceae bacterium]|nr:pitrilysin family protein [Clostridiaceae bacterium]